jgi:hypothetical protein
VGEQSKWVVGGLGEDFGKSGSWQPVVCEVASGAKKSERWKRICSGMENVASSDVPLSSSAD